MRKIFTILLCILLCVGCVGVAYYTTKDLIPSTNVENPNCGDSGSTGNKTPNADDIYDDNLGADNMEEQKNLVTAPNEDSLILEGAEIVTGASIYIGEESGNAMRFMFNVSSSLKEEVESNENKQLAFLTAPLKYFDSVNRNNYTYIDWVTALDNACKKIIWVPLEADDFIENGDGYTVIFRLDDVPYGKINNKFVCMLVLATNTENGTFYQYNSYASGVDYRSNARSVSLVAAIALNGYALGMHELDEDQLARLKKYLNDSIDQANGLKEATDDDSTVVIELSSDELKTLTVGEKFKVEVSYFPETVSFPIWYRSSDESIVTVDDKGNVTALKAGSAVVSVYIAGESVDITITVS